MIKEVFYMLLAIIQWIWNNMITVGPWAQGVFHAFSVLASVINPFFASAVALVTYFVPKWFIVLAGVSLFLEGTIISAGLVVTALRVFKLINPLS